MVMGRETQAFAEERGIPFELEDHRITHLDDDEYMSTMPLRMINEESTLQGVYEEDFARHRSLLMEPVSVNTQRYGGGHEEWPERRR